MNYDEDNVDEMALALLYLTTFQEDKLGPKRAWKSLAWQITDRLYEKGYITDPKNKNKSLMLTKEGAEHSEKLFIKHFKISDD